MSANDDSISKYLHIFIKLSISGKLTRADQIKVRNYSKENV